MTRSLRVLIACEESGIVRRAMREAGHDAVSCDLEPAADGSPHHVRGDVRPLLRERWDLVIAHPVCRYLAKSGLRWLYQGGRRYNQDGTENPRNLERWAAMEAACDFYAECWHANAPAVACENSDMHPYAIRALWDRGVPITSAYVAQPWWFGDDEDGPDNVTKGIHLVTRGLPRLYQTGTLDGTTARPECHHMAPGPDREKLRSRTKPGVARAFADQWANHINKEIAA